MDPGTQRALNDINQRFYRATALEFDATRSEPWAGWDRVLDAWQAASQRTSPQRVLDIGCGNGRFASFLAGRGAQPAEYRGIDASPALLEAASTRCAGMPGVRLEEIDFVVQDAETALPTGPFDLVVLFGVLHHVPGTATRERLLAAALRRLAPDGLMVATFWQFGARRRFRDRAIAWSTEADIDPAALEAGDLLLPWGEGDGPPRYCHFADEPEIEALVSALPAECVDVFDADGRSRDLNRYVLLRPRAS